MDSNSSYIFDVLSSNSQTFLMGLIGLIIFYRIQKRYNKELNDESAPSLPTKNQTLKLILSRRTIMPKDYNGGELDKEEISQILEAANWAPTHQKCEPWRYSIIGSKNIEKYLNFLESWYEEHSDKLPEQELNTFRSKISSVKCEWPYKVSHVILIGMKRQSRPDKRLPEWEEICAVAMSVQARISFCSLQNLYITLKSTPFRLQQFLSPWG